MKLNKLNFIFAFIFLFAAFLSGQTYHTAMRDTPTGNLFTNNNTFNLGFNAGVDTGTANNYIVTLPIPPDSYGLLMPVYFIPANTNTGSSTINVNGLGAISIYSNGAPVASGVLTAGVPIELIYDGFRFQTIAGGGGGGGNSLKTIQANGTTITPLLGAVNFVAGSNIILTPSGNEVIVNASGTISTSFSSISSGVNTSGTLVLGSGSSLNVSGTGTNIATGLTGNPSISVNQLVTQTSPQCDIRSYGAVIDGATDILPYVQDCINQFPSGGQPIAGHSSTILLPCAGNPGAGGGCYISNTSALTFATGDNYTLLIQGSLQCGTGCWFPSTFAVIQGSGSASGVQFQNGAPAVLSGPNAYGTLGTAILSTNVATIITPTFTSGSIANLVAGSAITVAQVASTTATAIRASTGFVTLTLATALRIPPGENITVTGCSDSSVNIANQYITSDDYPLQQITYFTSNASATTATGCTVSGFNDDKYESMRVLCANGTSSIMGYTGCGAGQITVFTNFTHLATDQWGEVVAGPPINTSNPQVWSDLTITNCWGMCFWQEGSTIATLTRIGTQPHEFLTAGSLESTRTYDIKMHNLSLLSSHNNGTCPSGGCPQTSYPFALLCDNDPGGLFYQSNNNGCDQSIIDDRTTIDGGVKIGMHGGGTSTGINGLPAFRDILFEEPPGVGILMDNRVTGAQGASCLAIDNPWMQDNILGGTLYYIGYTDSGTGTGCTRIDNIVDSDTSTITNKYFNGRLIVNNSAENVLPIPNNSTAATGVFNMGNMLQGEIAGLDSSLGPSVLPFGTLPINDSTAYWSSACVGTADCTVTVIPGPDGPNSLMGAAELDQVATTGGGITIGTASLQTYSGDWFILRSWVKPGSLRTYPWIGNGFGTPFGITSAHDTFYQNYGEASQSGCSPFATSIENNGWYPEVCIAKINTGYSTAHNVNFFIGAGYPPSAPYTFGNGNAFSQPCWAFIPGPNNPSYDGYTTETDVQRIREQMYHGDCPSTATVGTPAGTAATVHPLLVPNITVTSLTPGNCVQAGTGGLLTTASSACASGYPNVFTDGLTPAGLTTTGGISAGSLNGVINAGKFLVNNGVTDNCTAFNAMEAARPSGSTVYWPNGSYAISTSCNSGQGFLLQKPGQYIGAGVGSWSGSTFTGGTTLLGTVTSYQLGTTIESMAVDVSASSVFLDCFDLGYGSNSTTVNDLISDWGCNARGLVGANQGHAVLTQGGYGYKIGRGKVFNAYHVVAVRSSDTSVDGIDSYNGYDVIVKSADPSGQTFGVTVSNVNCDGPSAGTGCGMYVTSQSGDVNTTNIAFTNIVEHNSAYGFVVEADTGGVIYNVAVNNLQAFNVGGCEYIYYGDSNVSDSITGVSTSNSTCTTVSGNAFQNSANASLVYLNNTYARGVSGATTVGTFYPSPLSGWSVWTGNAADASLYSNSQSQSAAQSSIVSEYPTGSSTFNQTDLVWSNTAAAGLPGLSISGTTTPYSTRFTPGTLTIGHQFANNGLYNNYNKIVNYNQTGAEGIRLVPPSDADAASIEIGGTNAANTLWNWNITKGGAFYNAAGLLLPSTLSGYQGTGPKIQFAAGTVISGDCMKYDVNGNAVDAGAPCGTGSSGVTQIIAGTNVTISPVGGTGTVTINSTSTASTAFSALTSSTNTTAAMVVGSGATLTPTSATVGVLSANQLNGVSLAGLATGLVKNTTGTGVPSIAIAGTDYQTPLAFTPPLVNTSGTVACATCVTSASSLTANAFVIGSGAQGVQTTALTGYVYGNGSSAPTASTTIPVGSVSGISATLPITYTAGVIAAPTAVTSAASLTANSVMIGAGSQASQTTALQINSTTLAPTTLGANITIGTLSGASSSTLGGVLLSGGNQTGTGGTNSAGGGIDLSGGNNAGTSGTSQAGSVELEAGESSTGGQQGLIVYGYQMTEGTGTTTQWDLECYTSSSRMTVNDCPANPADFVGVTDYHSGSATEIHIPMSETPINASAAVTLYHTVCAGSTGGEVTDSGGTGPCPVGAGITVGKVIAVSGSWTLADGASFTASTTLPLVAMNRRQTLGSGDLSATGVTAGSYTNSNFTVDATGRITAASNGASGYITSLTTTGTSGNASVSSGVLNIPNYTYTLPAATTSTLGGVKTDGSTITNSSGLISCTTATTGQLGCVKPDGTTISISGGVISAVSSSAPTNSTTFSACTNPTSANSGTSLVYQVSSTCALTLPAGGTGYAWGIQNGSSNTLTVAPNTGVITIGSTTTANLTIPSGESVSFFWNGTNYQVGNLPLIASTGVTITPGATGNVLTASGATTLVGSSSDVTNQSTSQTSVTLATTPAAGQYRMLVYADLNTPCTTGSNFVLFTVNWADAGNARSATIGPMTLAAVQSTSTYLAGDFPLYVSSGNVTYTSTVSGTCLTGTSSYDVHASLRTP